MSVLATLRRLAVCTTALVLAATPAFAASNMGPDVSSHQHPNGTSIDWNRVKATGTPFAFVKATEGGSYKNPYFVSDWNGIAAAGMVRGTYHYARPQLPLSTAADQARAFISFTGTTVEPGDLPPALDMEEAGGLSQTDLVAWTHTFLDTVQSLTGRLPIIYTYPYFWRNAMANSTAFTRYPLWIADYNGGTGPGTPLVGGWPSWTFWQYTASSSIDGIPGGVDASTFCCGTSGLANLSYGGAPAGGGTPPPPPPPVTSPLPGAPGAVTASAGAGLATVSWSAASTPSMDPVTDYTITPRRDGIPQAPQSFSSAVTRQTLTGLTNGSSYTFSVHATNGAGNGLESSISEPVTPKPLAVDSRTDPAGTSPSGAVPVVALVHNPAGDVVTITKTGSTLAAAGYAPAAAGVTLTAPSTSTSVATATISLSASVLPSGAHADDLAVFRSGTRLSSCATASAPCLSSLTFDGTVLTLGIQSVPTGAFSVAANRVGRVMGSDRIATAVATSLTSYPAGRAGAVVLARSDSFADALTGTPLATARRAPLLLTGGAGLDSRVASELRRVLPVGGTVYLLGGTAGLTSAVADEVAADGYSVVRYAGPDRYSTAVAVATGLGSPSTVFLSTGTGFADGLSAGAAAAHAGGALLLTQGSSLPAPTLAYLRAHPGRRFAVGGDAVRSDSLATPLAGADRYATAVAVARILFPTPRGAGIASGADFPDALSTGPALAAAGSPLLLTAPSALPPVVAGYLHEVAASAQVIHLSGGQAAVSDAVGSAALLALIGSP